MLTQNENFMLPIFLLDKPFDDFKKKYPKQAQEVISGVFKVNSIYISDIQAKNNVIALADSLVASHRKTDINSVHLNMHATQAERNAYEKDLLVVLQKNQPILEKIYLDESYENSMKFLEGGIDGLAGLGIGETFAINPVAGIVTAVLYSGAKAVIGSQQYNKKMFDEAGHILFRIAHEQYVSDDNYKLWCDNTIKSDISPEFSMVFNQETKTYYEKLPDDLKKLLGNFSDMENMDIQSIMKAVQVNQEEQKNFLEKLSGDAKKAEKLDLIREYEELADVTTDLVTICIAEAGYKEAAIRFQKISKASIYIVISVATFLIFPINPIGTATIILKCIKGIKEIYDGFAKPLPLEDGYYLRYIAATVETLHKEMKYLQNEILVQVLELAEQVANLDEKFTIKFAKLQDRIFDKLDESKRANAENKLVKSVNKINTLCGSSINKRESIFLAFYNSDLVNIYHHATVIAGNEIFSGHARKEVSNDLIIQEIKRRGRLDLIYGLLPEMMRFIYIVSSTLPDKKSLLDTESLSNTNNNLIGGIPYQNIANPVQWALASHLYIWARQLTSEVINMLNAQYKNHIENLLLTGKKIESITKDICSNAFIELTRSIFKNEINGLSKKIKEILPKILSALANKLANEENIRNICSILKIDLSKQGEREKLFLQGIEWQESKPINFDPKIFNLIEEKSKQISYKIDEVPEGSFFFCEFDGVFNVGYFLMDNNPIMIAEEIGLLKFVEKKEAEDKKSSVYKFDFINGSLKGKGLEIACVHSIAKSSVYIVSGWRKLENTKLNISFVTFIFSKINAYINEIKDSIVKSNAVLSYEKLKQKSLVWEDEDLTYLDLCLSTFLQIKMLCGRNFFDQEALYITQSQFYDREKIIVLLKDIFTFNYSICSIKVKDFIADLKKQIKNAVASVSVLSGEQLYFVTDIQNSLMRYQELSDTKQLIKNNDYTFKWFDSIAQSALDVFNFSLKTGFIFAEKLQQLDDCCLSCYVGTKFFGGIENGVNASVSIGLNIYATGSTQWEMIKPSLLSLSTTFKHYYPTVVTAVSFVMENMKKDPIPWMFFTMSLPLAAKGICAKQNVDSTHRLNL